MVDCLDAEPGRRPASEYVRGSGGSVRRAPAAARRTHHADHRGAPVPGLQLRRRRSLRVRVDPRHPRSLRVAHRARARAGRRGRDAPAGSATATTSAPGRSPRTAPSWPPCGVRASRRPGARHLQRLPDPHGGGPTAGCARPNEGLRFVCRDVTCGSRRRRRFTSRYPAGPGAAAADRASRGPLRGRRGTLERLEGEGRVVLRYVDEAGGRRERANPNGSMRHIAGSCNERGNVLGMMPHPERAAEAMLGSTDGLATCCSASSTRRRMRMRRDAGRADAARAFRCPPSRPRTREFRNRSPRPPRRGIRAAHAHRPLRSA
jgi:hypothetical protein